MVISPIDQKADIDASREYPLPKVQRKTSDYRLDKIGRKIKAHNLKFNKGEDDGQKGVTEQMKKTYKDFVAEHALELTEKELNVLEHELNEVLGKDAKAGDWIHDFVHSNNPQFKGKSADKRKQMALAAYYAAQRNEEVEHIDELNLHFSADDANNTVNAKKMVAHLKKRGISANYQSGSQHKAIVQIDAKNSSDKAYVKNKVKDRYDVDVKEELKGNQHKLDKNKNGKLDMHDFKLLRKEDAEQIDEAIHADDYAATSEKSNMTGGYRPHVVNKETGKTMHLSATSYKSPEHAKAHAKAYLTGYAKTGMHAADRAAIDYAKANKQHIVKEDTEMNEDLHPEADKVLKHIKPEHHAKYKPDLTKKHYTGNFADRSAVLKAAERAGHLNEDLHPEADKVLKHIKPEHHAKYKPDLAKGTYKGDYADRSAVLKAAERAGHLKEASVFDWKNTPRETSDSNKTKTYHDVKKISTGTVYTKQFDKDGVSKGTGGDAAAKAENAPKRGRGRPKKDKFAEAVEFLLALSEEHFDDLMEEGFDTFLESYDQLDELSKATLGSYIKMATNKIPSGLAVNAHQAGAEPTGSKARKGFLAKANKRIGGIAKATDRLTK